jgi:hypothetical protein
MNGIQIGTPFGLFFARWTNNCNFSVGENYFPFLILLKKILVKISITALS